MNKFFKHLRHLTLGIFILMSADVFAAKNACYTDKEFKDFKTLYIKLQNQLNYEAKDAYLDKNMQVQLKPHPINTPYPGKEFETAIFGEYQNSLRKVGKLYQDAKFNNADNFKSNELLVNFMRAIDDSSFDSASFIKNTKIKDVINSLEVASKNKYGNGPNNKFVLNSGDKYLLEKLLTHAQDRLCSVTKYEKTGKGTNYFKADYLQQVKNAPLNMLISTIKNAPIGKDTQIDLKASSSLTANLVDTDIAIKSAMTENISQLSDWVKKVKSRGAACLAAIRTKSFANKIQGQIQGCNFGLFMDTLSQDNANNLESIMHFINANERLLDHAVAKAETGLDEMKLEGFISKAFDQLGSEIKCTIVDSANKDDKKLFIKNLPFDEKTNIHDTSDISCKLNDKILSKDECNRQFDLKSDSLGRGIELKPRDKVDLNLIFNIKNAKSCSNIRVRDLKYPFTNSKDDTSSKNDDDNDEKLRLACEKKSTPELPFVWSSEKKLCLPKKSNGNGNGDGNGNGNDDGNKSTNLLKSEDSQLLPDKDLLTPDTDDSGKKLTTPKSNELSQKKENSGTGGGLIIDDKDPNAERLKCVAKKKDLTAYVWLYEEKLCAEVPLDEAKDKCEKQTKTGFTYLWLESSLSCEEVELDNTQPDKAKLICESQKKEGFLFVWDASKNTCNTVPKNDDKAKDSDLSQDKDRVACETKNSTWVRDVNDGTPAEKYKWDGKVCKDMKAKKESDDKDSDTNSLDNGPKLDQSPKQAPGRFTPINIPSRQMYILPGMP